MRLNVTSNGLPRLEICLACNDAATTETKCDIVSEEPGVKMLVPGHQGYTGYVCRRAQRAAIALISLWRVFYSLLNCGISVFLAQLLQAEHPARRQCTCTAVIFKLICLNFRWADLYFIIGKFPVRLIALPCFGLQEIGVQKGANHKSQTG